MSEFNDLMNKGDFTISDFNSSYSTVFEFKTQLTTICVPEVIPYGFDGNSYTLRISKYLRLFPSNYIPIRTSTKITEFTQYGKEIVISPNSVVVAKTIEEVVFSNKNLEFELKILNFWRENTPLSFDILTSNFDIQTPIFIKITNPTQHHMLIDIGCGIVNLTVNKKRGKL